MPEPEVPSPIDLQSMTDAREWERTAMGRPYRLDFFQAFADELARLDARPMRVLELGSGPGFLALHLLQRFPALNLVLLDFSAAMHTLARQRLGGLLDRVTFVERDFRQPDWHTGLGSFDAVITLQAVHELRYKRHAGTLHAAVRYLLSGDGIYLVCDHYHGEGAMDDDQLYMSLDEHRESLLNAGFGVHTVLTKGGRALYRATDSRATR